MTTKELCVKYHIDPLRIAIAKHYVQVDEKGRPTAAFDRVEGKEEWSDKTAVVQIEYDREVLAKEIKKLEEK